MSTGVQHEFDRSALGEYLAEHINGFGVLQAVDKFSHGQSNPTYRLSTSTGSFVLRAKPPGKLLKSAHQVDREFRVMSALADTGVPVPRTYFLAPDDNPLGSMFFVMEHVAGRIFWDPALPELNAAERTALFDAMNESLAALHRIDPAAAGLADFGRPGNYYARQIDRWTGQYQASETQPSADMDWAAAWLADNVPADDGIVTIVHGDYRLDNMIFDSRQPTIAAILDWELSTLGHPLADLAYQCMQWRLGNDRPFLRGLGGCDRQRLGIPEEQDYVASYCQRRGIEAPAHWRFYLVYCFFRLAAILQGIVKRALDGTASNPRDLGSLQQTVKELARRAHEACEE